MNQDEFERLERRFGKNVSAWPAPYRQEATLLLATRESRAEVDGIDRLILSLPEEAPDQAAFERKVLRQIGQRGRHINASGLRRGFGLLPAAASATALVLIAVGLSGYSLAGRNVEMSDDLLLAFAVGETNSDLLQPFRLDPTDGGNR